VFPIRFLFERFKSSIFRRTPQINKQSAPVINYVQGKKQQVNYFKFRMKCETISSSGALDSSSSAPFSKKQHNFSISSWEFPQLLLDLLEDAENDGNEHIISWTPDGLAFKVHQRDEFMKQLIPNYFGLTKYNSFARQLQLWGFVFCKGAPSKPKFGTCKFPTSPSYHPNAAGGLCSHSCSFFECLSDSHPCFIRGQNPSCLSSMKRTKIKGGKSRRAVSKKAAPTSTAVWPYPVKTISKNIEEEAEESSWMSSSFVVSSRSGIEQDWGSTVVSGSSSF
jgi:hypothetical protein